MKTRLLTTLLFLCAFNAKAVTYNFNFYNEDNPDPKLTAGPLASPAGEPSVAIENITPPLAPVSTQVAAQTPEGITNFIYSVGLQFYTQNKYFEERGKPVYGEYIGYRFIDDTNGIALKLGFGKVGGYKLQVSGLKETFGFSSYCYSNIACNSIEKYTSYGLGLDLKKEFLISSFLGIEVGGGGKYLKGKKDESRVGNGYAWYAQDQKTTQMAYYGLVAINFYYKQVSLNLQGQLGSTKTVVGDSKINNQKPILLAGLSYHF